MKNINVFVLLTLLMTTNVIAQTTEKEILNLSLEKFKWKTTGQFDLLADLFDEDLVLIHLTGHVTTKSDRINQLKTKRFVYNKIEQKDASAKVYGNTAVLVGRAKFTVNGGSSISYTPKSIQGKTTNGDL